MLGTCFGQPLTTDVTGCQMRLRLHTKDGARCTVIALGRATVKDRKVIVKSFKDYACKIATEEHGHNALLAIFDLVDDTVLIKRNILSALLSSPSTIFEDAHARKVSEWVAALSPYLWCLFQFVECY